MRKAINVDERLSLALRFLATGHNFIDLEAEFKIHQTTISGIVVEVCNSIYDCLIGEYLKITQKKTGNVLLRKRKKDGSFLIASEQRTGNIISIPHSKYSGSDFYNYKGFFSLVI